MFVWSTKASSKVHQLGPDWVTLCQLENNGPEVAARYVCTGQAIPDERVLCGICRYLGKRPVNETPVRPEGTARDATTPAQVESHRVQLTLPPTSTSSRRPAVSLNLKGNTPKLKSHPDDAQHHRLTAQRAYELDRLAMSQYARSARSAHCKLLASLAGLRQCPPAQPLLKPTRRPP